MGVQVLDSLVDAEIRSLIRKLNDFPFLQTRSCCSGWSDPNEKDGASDGVNRVWRGSPYLSWWCLDNTECLKFLFFLMSKMIFDHNAQVKDKEQEVKYKELLSSVSFEDDGKQLFHVTLEYREKKLVMNVLINDRERTPEQVKKIFQMIENLVDRYHNELKASGT